jgi:hypothetical protein
MTGRYAAFRVYAVDRTAEFRWDPYPPLDDAIQ